MNSEEGNKIGIKEIERKQRRWKTGEIERTREGRGDFRIGREKERGKERR